MIEALAALVSITALLISIWTFLKGRKYTAYDTVDNYLMQINTLHLQYPKFADQRFTDAWPNVSDPDDPDCKYRYFFFAALTWNVLDSIFSRGLEHDETLVGVFEFFCPLHRRWFEDNLTYHSEPFAKFVKENYLHEKANAYGEPESPPKANNAG